MIDRIARLSAYVILAIFGSITLFSVANAADLDVTAMWKMVPNGFKNLLSPCLNFQIGTFENETAATKALETAGVVMVQKVGDKYEVRLAKPPDGINIKQANPNYVCITTYDIASAVPNLLEKHYTITDGGIALTVAYLNVEVHLTGLFSELQKDGYPAKLDNPIIKEFRVLLSQDPFSKKWRIKALDQYERGQFTSDNVPMSIEGHNRINLFSFTKQVKIVGFDSGFMAQGPIEGNRVSTVIILGVGYAPKDNTAVVYAGITTKGNGYYYVVRSDCVGGTGVWYCARPVSVKGVLIVRR